MKTAIRRVLTVGAAAVAVLIVGLTAAAIAPVIQSASIVQTAKADDGGGLIGQLPYPALLDGKRPYTASLLYSDAVQVAGYGSVQIMASNSVTASQVMTVTPQFSLQAGSCGSVSQWFTATETLFYQPYSIVSSATTVTETVGAYQQTSVTETLRLTGSAIAGREITVLGTCLRARIDFSNAGQTYTPTLIIRAVNRQ